MFTFDLFPFPFRPQHKPKTVLMNKSELPEPGTYATKPPTPVGDIRRGYTPYALRGCAGEAHIYTHSADGRFPLIGVLKTPESADNGGNLANRWSVLGHESLDNVAWDLVSERILPRTGRYLGRDGQEYLVQGIVGDVSRKGVPFRGTGPTGASFAWGQWGTLCLDPRVPSGADLIKYLGPLPPPPASEPTPVSVAVLEAGLKELKARAEAAGSGRGYSRCLITVTLSPVVEALPKVNPPSGYWDTRTLSNHAHVSGNSIWNWVRSRGLPHYRPSEHRIQFDPAVAVSWILANVRIGGAK